MDYYRIRGVYCGYDRNGVFHCECGKCELLYSDDRDISEYGGSNRRNRRDRRNNDGSNKPCLFRSCFRFRRFH